MFDRFTTGALDIVVHAQEEAVRAGDGWVGTEHLVVTLAGEDGIAGQ